MWRIRWIDLFASSGIPPRSEESDDELVQLRWKEEIVDDALFLDRSDAIEWFLG
jgi:hypothetical protein